MYLHAINMNKGIVIIMVYIFVLFSELTPIQASLLNPAHSNFHKSMVEVSISGNSTNESLLTPLVIFGVGRGEMVGKFVGLIDGAVSHSCSDTAVNVINPPYEALIDTSR